jgi:hypothetical protein
MVCVRAPRCQGSDMEITTKPNVGESPERAAVGELVDVGLLDELISRVDAGELQVTGKGGFLPGFLPGLIEAVLERNSVAEVIEHLGLLPGEQTCVALVFAVLDCQSRGWRAMTMTPRALRRVQDLRRELHVPPADTASNHAVTSAA